MFAKRTLTTTTLAASCVLAVGLSSSYAGHHNEGKKQGHSMAEPAGKDIVDVASEAGTFNTLIAAAQAAGLVDALKGDGPITVFAPNDEAFAKLGENKINELLDPENKDLLAAILSYHVVPGKLKAEKVLKAKTLDTLNGQRTEIAVNDDGAFIDGSKIIATDIKASNGIIHVIDSVILPSSDDIVATAVEAGAFNTLAAALQAAGLVEALQGDGPFTVFAPTDDAFAALPEGTVESLLKPENKDKLSAVLTYHVVPGRVFSEAAAAGATVETLQGQTITTMSKDGKVFINNAQVINADIDASNGVIHVINKVLLPPDKSAKASPAERIREAIRMGAPRYNHGDHAGCAAIYQIAVMSLAGDPSVPDGVARMADKALSDAEHTHSAGKKAWIYRHMMDDAMDQMSETPMASAAR